MLNAAERARAGLSKKVVLLLPPYSGPPLGPPAGLLSLAAPLLRGGYEVRLIDAAVEPDFLAAAEKEIPEALCFGVSLLTGPMIDGAVAASRLVKRLRPELPVVFGGWHPTLLPAQTLTEPFVDVVVRHQGEVTFAEVLARLHAGESLDGVAGCWYKHGGEARSNPDRPMTKLSELLPPAYEMADFDAYERAGAGRKLPYATSIGCPYTCQYCTDMVFYSRRFNALEAQRAADEMAALAEKHRLDEVALLDSNFLVNTRRALVLAQALIDRGTTLRWTFQASTDLLCRLSDEDVGLLARSGVHHIGFGTESASEDVLHAMAKTHQRVEDMFETARKCRRAGIRVTFNLIFGYPGETAADRQMTLRVMSEIAERFDNVTFSPNVFTPYPGIPVWPELERRGLRQPQSLEGWREMALGRAALPWLGPGDLHAVEQGMRLLQLASELSKELCKTPGVWRRNLLLSQRRAVCWRIRNDFHAWPLELWLYEGRRRIAMRRSLLTGRELGYGLDQAC